MALRPALAAVLVLASVMPGLVRAQAPPSESASLIVMLRPAPRGTPPALWRSAFAARARAAGLIVRDTLAAPGAPWSLRVLRAEIDATRFGRLDLAPEPDESRFAGAPRGAAALARALERFPEVEWAEPDMVRETGHAVDVSLPPEPLLMDTRQWGLWNAGPGSAYGGLARADIGAPEAWALLAARGLGGYAGSGTLARDRGRSAAALRSTGADPVPAPGAPPVLLAIADTGIDPDHPEFAPAGGGAARIVHARSIAEPGAAIHDSLGHGTMVAAIMAAGTGEGAHFDSLGMAGVCGGCEVMPLRITRGARRTALASDIALAILAAAERGARVMNLSFAGGGRSRLERLALAHAIGRGTLVVTASGNRGYTEPSLRMYPAAYAADGLCLAVGASDMWDRRAAFSSYGPHLDLVAPGLEIWSAWMTYPAATGATYPGYVAGSGTSFAAPFASGAAGLLAALRPDLGAEDLRRLLRDCADDVGETGPDNETGAGRLDAAAALAALPESAGMWREEVAATSWNDDGTGTLALGEDGPGAFAARLSGRRATRVLLRARLALPDSFAESARIWPRVTGTSTIRPDFAQPHHAAWCAARIEGRTVVLEGYAFRLEPDSTSTAQHSDEPPDRAAETHVASGAAAAQGRSEASERRSREPVAPRAHAAPDGGGPPEEATADDLWIPLPPDQMRFAFTVVGPVRKTASTTPPAPAPLLVRPNPARGAVRITTPGPGSLTIFDVRGRAVWKAAARTPGAEILWPGTDASGRRFPAGLYFVRFEGGGERRSARIARIG